MAAGPTQPRRRRITRRRPCTTPVPRWLPAWPLVPAWRSSPRCGDCDWDNHDIDIDVDRYNNINANNRISNTQNKWQHNAANRDGVPYRDARSRQQYGRQLDGASQRTAFRGDDAQRAQARDKARASMDRAGIERPATSNRQARQQMREAQAGNTVGNRLQTRANDTRAAERRQDARSTQARLQNNQVTPRRQGEGQARQLAQNRPGSSAGRARNNAFDGVRAPSRTSMQASRGRTSQSFAQRPGASRAAGHTIFRPSAPVRRGEVAVDEPSIDSGAANRSGSALANRGCGAGSLRHARKGRGRLRCGAGRGETR